MAYKRKLIEVAIPLAAINEQSAREKQPFTRNHPRSLHIWWARRPHVAARAVLFAQLIDDPSADIDRFPTVETQRIERERLHALMRRMVVWENSNDPNLLADVRFELKRQFGENQPTILDPFAGGGTIPLEAQRLGLKAHASDLNPVAVLINKALIEIPPTFANRDPTFPGSAAQRNSWPAVTGLADDIRRYGDWMRAQAEDRLGAHFPKAVLPDGSTANAVAWIWARTVVCPNPACGIEMPLVRSWWLGKRKGKEAYIVPSVVAGKVEFTIGHNMSDAPRSGTDGTVGRTGAICISCKTAVSLAYVREQSREGDLGARLMAIVAEGVRSKIYLPPDHVHSAAGRISRPTDLPEGEIPEQALGFRVQAYGMSTWIDLFTNRQLAALSTFTELIGETRDRILEDALSAGIPLGDRLAEGGSGAASYADAVATYLGIALSRYTDLNNALSSWNSTNENVRALFSRQAIPMTWDFVEVNPLGQISLAGTIESAANAIGVWDSPVGSAVQADASSRSYDDYVVSTDPPYYDNIGYSDLSDFFYIWLRKSLQTVHPELLSTLLVPKAEELVANPYRHGGSDGAREFFETGFEHVFEQARASANAEYPITVYYAFKQSESDEGGTASTGWVTILGSMIGAGWTITATWPIRSEREGRMRDVDSNALATSVVLALRPRASDAATTDRRGFIAALKRELAPALRDLQSGGISPVDLPQAAIGPGMAVFSRYSSVIESDGSAMPVRAALAHINEMLDEVLTEQEGDFDPTTRFALAWYRGHGYESAAYGDAEGLARARGTAVSVMERSGILTARAGRVQLFRPMDLASDYNVLKDEQTSAWEALNHAIRVLNTSGIAAAGIFLQTASQRADGAVDLDLVKELAYLVFQVAEKSGWSRDAQTFNDIATSWGDMLQAEQAAESVNTSVTLDIEENQ